MVAAVLLSFAMAGFYTSPQEPLEIRQAAGVLIERGDQRPLSVRVTWPAEGGPWPVVVFSHGMYGSETGNGPLVDTWAAHGYVVVQPTHGDSLKYADAETRRKALRGNLDNVGSWDERPGEISLVIDRLPWLQQNVPGLAGKVDASRIGVGGHSFGAWTTQVVAGMRLSGAPAMGDERPRAFVVISPSGVGGGIRESSFETMRGPMLFISGDNDEGRGEWDPKVYRRQAFDLAPAGGRTLVWIDGAHHDFGGINGRTRPALRGLAGGANEHHVEIVKSSTLAFWDATLKSDPTAQAWLAERKVESVGGVKVETR